MTRQGPLRHTPQCHCMPHPGDHCMTFPALKTSILVAALSIGTLSVPVAAQTGGAASTATAPTAQAPAVNNNAVAAHYAHLVHANYTDTLTSAQAMRTAIQAFTAATLGGDTGAGAQNLAGRTRVLRPDRSLPFLRRPDRQRQRPRRPHQRLAHGRVVCGQRGRQAQQRAGQQPQVRHQQEEPVVHRTSAAAKKTLPPAGTPSSSCCGARTCRKPGPATAALRTLWMAKRPMPTAAANT